MSMVSRRCDMPFAQPRWIFFLAALVGHSQAQEVNRGPDTAAVAQHTSAARAHAGTNWTAAVDFLCSVDPDIGGRDQSPMIEPTQLFDNLYVIGRSGTVVYAITTSEGIILIDSGYEGQTESVLMPGLVELGLDPADIEYVVIAHGHRDHFGGARYLQDRYGARIVLAAEDWDLLEQADTGVDEAPPPPTRDLEAVEGIPITLGDTSVTLAAVPGHTPGSIGLIFPVRDGGASHTAGLFGGTILLSSRISDEGLRQYLRSIAYFAEVAGREGVDVEIQNHPIFDSMLEKLAKLKARDAGAPHPFVVGEAVYQGFLNVISECTQVELARRGST